MPRRFRLSSQQLAHIFGPAIDAKEGAIGCAHVAELGGDHELLPLALDGAADQFLVGAHAIHVGGVEEGDAELEGAVDGGDRFRIVTPGIEVRHAHAAQPHGGHFERSEIAMMHIGLLGCFKV